jgi:hypothetical protein
MTARPLIATVLGLMVAGLAQAAPAHETTRAPELSRAGGDTTTFRTAPRKAKGSGATVDYRVEPGATADAVRITLRIDGIADPAGASLRLVAEDGLAMAPGTAPTRTLPAGPTATVSVEVNRQGPAARYLNVFLTQHGITDAISIRASVEAPAKQATSQPALKQTPEGERIAPLPVK